MKRYNMCSQIPQSEHLTGANNSISPAKRLRLQGTTGFVPKADNVSPIKGGERLFYAGCTGRQYDKNFSDKLICDTFSNQS